MVYSYPHGSARNPNSVQRGSVQFISMYPGDPTTPGYPSYENSTRTEGTNIPSIPSLPISWANAQALLGEIAKSGGNRTVKLVNHGKGNEDFVSAIFAECIAVDTKVTPIWNTVGVIPGHIKNEVVVVGNHRDGMSFLLMSLYKFCLQIFSLGTRYILLHTLMIRLHLILGYGSC
jgi:N-acetylated-alpha-linked acidic dipeptidase